LPHETGRKHLVLAWPKGLFSPIGPFFYYLFRLMNSKSVVFAVFALWGIICWRWYVCGLMGACDPQTEQIAQEEVVALPPETETREIDPISPAADNKPSADPAQPVSPDRMDKVQMELVQDRMIIHFPYKSTRKEDNVAIDTYLAGLAQQLIASGEIVSITGHTDFVGETSDNQTFGLRRAHGIRDILIKKGVPKNQISCKSFGERKPVATNDTPYGRYLNRRVEIKIGK